MNRRIFLLSLATPFIPKSSAPIPPRSTPSLGETLWTIPYSVPVRFGAYPWESSYEQKLLALDLYRNGMSDSTGLINVLE